MDSPQERQCKRCASTMWINDLPGFGPVWQCGSCLSELQDAEGNQFTWVKPLQRMRAYTAKERRVKSQRACPECLEPMWEVVMEDFGSRWQCENCRLTVFATGGVQKWRAKKPEAAADESSS